MRAKILHGMVNIICRSDAVLSLDEQIVESLGDSAGDTCEIRFIQHVLIHVMKSRSPSWPTFGRVGRGRSLCLSSTAFAQNSKFGERPDVLRNIMY